MKLKNIEIQQEFTRPEIISYVKQRKYKYQRNCVTSFFGFRAIFYEIKVQLSFKLIAFRLCYPNTFYVEWLEDSMYVKKEEGFCLKK